MPNFNKWIAAGFLTRDPEIRYLLNGTAVCSFTLAINRNWTAEGGEKKEEVSFFDCVAFGNVGAAIGQYVTKGDPLMVEARMKQETWVDKATGNKRSSIKAIVESFQFLRTKQAGEAPAETTVGHPSRMQDRPAPAPVEDEDVPF